MHGAKKRNADTYGGTLTMRIAQIAITAVTAMWLVVVKEPGIRPSRFENRMNRKIVKT